MASFLRQVGGREINDDALVGERQPGSVERAAHALAALGDRLVGQAHNDETRQPGRDLHLHVDGHRLDPLKRDRRDVRNHRPDTPGYHPDDSLAYNRRQEHFMNKVASRDSAPVPLH